MVNHESEREGARKSNGGGEELREKVDHRDGKGSKDQRNDTKVPFWFCERVKLVR